MVNFKKGLAMFIVFIMMFSSLSVEVFAADAVECRYTIEVYYMNTDGAYPEVPDYIGDYGAVADSVVLAPYEEFENEGFTFDSEKSVYEFTANADNSSVGKLYYSRNKYKATYIYEDLLGEQTEEAIVYFGAEIPAFEATPGGKPAKQGYNFIMWSLDTEERIAVPETMPAYDIDMYPIYESRKYTYTFDAGEGGAFSNGNQVLTLEYSYGDIPKKEVEIPVAPHKEFVDWDENIPELVTSSVTFNAIYNDIPYSVIFMNGEEEIARMDYFYEDEIEELDIPEGYEAWTLSDGTYVEFPYIVKGDLVFYAASAPAENEDYVDFRTEIYRQNESGEWVVADKVERGETVKARVFIDTGFAVGDGQVLLFINEDVFDSNYSDVKSLATNPSVTSTTGQHMAVGKCTSPPKTGSLILDLVENGYISEDFISKHTPITFTLSFMDMNSHRISGDEWFCEFELTVKEDAVGKGNFFIVPETIQDLGDGYYAYISFTKGVEGESSRDDDNMIYSEPSTTVESTPVSTGYGRVILNANGGVFKSTGSEQFIFDAEVDAPIEIYETPIKVGYVFGGWDVELPDSMTEDVIETNAVWKAAENTLFKVTVNYTDFSDNEPVEVVKSFDFAGRTGNSIEIVDSLPASPDEETTYILISELLLDYNELDISAENIMNGFIEADGSTELILYFIPVVHKVTFNSNEGIFVDGETIKYVEVPHGSLAADYIPDVDVVLEGYDFSGWLGIYETTRIESDFTFVPNWSAKKYDVVWVVDSKETVESVEYKSQIYGFEPEKEGYSFIGWSVTADDPTDLIIFPIETPLGGATFYAVWEINKHNVIYKIDNELYNEIEDVEYGTSVEIINEPTKEGYYFGGWDKIDFTMPDNDVIVNGSWIKETYNIIWQNGDEATTVTYTYGDEIIVPVPQKTGYTFAGWNGFDNLTIMPDIGDNGDSVTFTAIWTANKYDAVFNANDGAFADNSKTKSVITAYDSQIEFAEIPARAGYIFNGWEPEVGVMDSEGKTFEATWIEIEEVAYSVETYVMNTAGEYDMTSKLYEGEVGATVNVKPETVEKGFTLNDGLSVYEGKIKEDGSLILKIYIDRQSYTLKTVVDGKETTAYYLYRALVSVATPSKTGYTFSGWDSTIPETMPANDVTVSGKFTVNKHDVIYTVDGNEYERITNVAYGTEVKIITPLSKEGHTFSGWNASDFVMPDSDVIISATFSVNNYTVNWVIDGRTTTETYAFGASVKTPSTPVKEGYKFIKWNAEIPATMPAENITITAVFDRVHICPDCGDEIVGESAINAHIALEARMKATVSIKNNPGTKTIKYGEILNLTAINNKPSDVKIYWYVDGEKKGEGEAFKVSPLSGTVEVTVKLVDSNGDVLKNTNGNEISDSQKVSVNAGFFQKIISFFKNLFGVNRNVIQSI